MASIIETIQVVVVLAFLPILLVCLIIAEPFDRLRFGLPKIPKTRPVRREAKRARPTLKSELA
jgi:hypothetical protein